MAYIPGRSGTTQIDHLLGELYTVFSFVGGRDRGSTLMRVIFDSLGKDGFS